MNKKKILFVCLGNICRSPAAEGVFKSIIAQKGLDDNFYVDSAGTNGFHNGEEADSRMKRRAAIRGVILNSISRQVTSDDFEIFDYIIVMDDSNIENVKKFNPSGSSHYKIHKFTNFIENKAHNHVPDPYWGDDKDFDLVLDIVENASLGFISYLENNK